MYKPQREYLLIVKDGHDWFGYDAKGNEFPPEIAWVEPRPDVDYFAIHEKNETFWIRAKTTVYFDDDGVRICGRQIKLSEPNLRTIEFWVDQGYLA